MLKPSEASKVKASQARLQGMFKPQKSEVKNIDPAMNLESTSIMQFRGRLYRVPPVGWQAGLELQRQYLKLQDLQRKEDQIPDDKYASSIEHLKEMEILMNRMFRFFKSLCSPMSWWETITWRFRDPFQDATQQELGEMLGFFFECRTKSSIRYIEQQPTAMKLLP